MKNLETNLVGALEQLEKSRKELNELKSYVKHQNQLLNIEREELKEVSDTLKSAKQLLSEWIESSTNQMKIFKDNNMNSSALCSDAMRTAYTNAKNLL